MKAWVLPVAVPIGIGPTHEFRKTCSNIHSWILQKLAVFRGKVLAILSLTLLVQRCQSAGLGCSPLAPLHVGSGIDGWDKISLKTYGLYFLIHINVLALC